VTSINVSGGTTGLTTSGGPVTTSGTITLAGTLNVANGGTGATTLSSGYLLKGNGTSAVSASVIYDDGTNTGIGTTTLGERLVVQGAGKFTTNATNFGAGQEGALIDFVPGTFVRIGHVNGASGSAKPVVFMVGGNEVGRFDTSGNFIVTNGQINSRNTALFFGDGADNSATVYATGGPVKFFANASEAMRIVNSGNLGINTTTPTGRLSVVSSSSTGVATSAWSGNYSVFGPNAGSTTGAAVALGYNAAIDAAEILALAPSVAWKPLNLYSAGLNLYASSGGIGASLNGSGTFSAVTDIRAPIFYDSANTAYYLDPAGGSRLNAVYVTGGDVDPSNIGAGVGIGNIYEPATAFAAYGIAFGASAGQHGAIVYGSNIMYFGTENGSDNTMMTKATLNSSGSFTANGDVRAPLFYDSDNTAFYLDPAGTSVLNGIGAGTITATNFLATNAFYVNGTTYYLNSTGGGWYSNARIQSEVDMRAPIFYDFNNTAYYVDPASTSNLVGLTVANTITGNAATATNLSTVRTNWSTNGTITAVVGQLAWKNYGNNHTIFDASNSSSPDGGAVNNTNAQVAWAGTYPTLMGWNGVNTYGVRVDSARVADSASAVDFNNLTNKTGGTGTYTTSGDFRAPIFYDSNNTGYYVDPASASALYQINTGIGINLSGGIALVASGATLANAIGARLTESYGPVWNCDNSATWHHQVINGSMLCGFLASGTNWGSGKVVANSDMRATLFYDYSNTAYYVDPNAGSNVLGDFRVNQNGAAGIQLLSTTGTQSLWIRTGYSGAPTPSVSATNVQFQSSGSSAGSFNFWSGNTLALTITGDYAEGAGSLRAPIYYDTNNTGYYWNFADAAGSFISTIITGFAYFQSNRDTSSNSAPLQAYSTGGTGATMAFHRAGVFAVNMGLDSDNIFRIGGWSASNNLIQLDMSGNFTALTSSRSPIFYDSNNTAYFVDPNNTSNLVGLTVANEISGNISGYSRYLPTAYIGGQQLNPQTYFSSSIGLKVAMTAVAGVWSDTLWINGYSGGDVLNMCALHTSRQATPRMWISSQASNATSYGTLYEFPTLGYNSGNTNGLFAGIFYDSANTGYYVDPNGGSVLFDLNVTGTGNKYLIIASTTSNEAMVRYIGASGPSWYVGKRTSTSLVDTASFHFYSEAAGATVAGIDTSGNIFASSSMRAQIFYDSNNTGYYVDPAGFSNMSSANGMWMCGTTNPGDTINGSTWYGTGRNNLDQVQLAGYYGIRLRTAGVIMDLAGDYAQINGSYRAPIFYDSDNTGYYFNGSGTTYGEVFGAGTRFYTGYDSGVTNSMSCSNWFRSNGSSGWFNASYGGGINMEDSTWVRVYNAKNLYCAADIAAAGNVTAYYSDERLKTKTGGIDNALEKVAGLSGFLYVENDLARSLGYTNEKQQVGVSAQAVQAVLPEAVSLAPVDFETLEDGTIISKSGENYLTVDYSRLVPLLIEAIKELTNKVKALEAKEQ
jgi:hypothetical protein